MSDLFALTTDAMALVLEFCLEDEDIEMHKNLLLTCKLFQNILSLLWKKKYPRWPFDRVPRAPILIRRKGSANLTGETYTLLFKLLIRFMDYTQLYQRLSNATPCKLFLSL